MSRPVSTDAVLDPHHFPLAKLAARHRALVRKAEDIREAGIATGDKNWVERHIAVLDRASKLIARASRRQRGRVA